MRIYGSIQISFWENSEIQVLSDQAKLLAIYLLTGPHSNMLGCYRLPDGYIVEDLKWDIKDVKDSINQLADINFLTRDSSSSWLVVHHFLKWNPIQNPRQGIGIQKLLDIVPIQSTVIKPLINGLLMYGKYFDKEFVNRLHVLENPSETLSQNFLADKNKNQDKNQNNDKNNILITDNDFKSQAVQILNFLNEKAGRAYRGVDENLKLIIDRLKSGATEIDCRQVIAKKTREWKKDIKMNEYLRPATLFDPVKFEQYMGELVLPSDQGDAHELK